MKDLEQKEFCPILRKTATSSYENGARKLKKYIKYAKHKFTSEDHQTNFINVVNTVIMQHPS